MKKLVLITAILGTAALLCADNTVDFSHSTDWARFHTYSWLKVQASNQLWENRIQRDVDEQLMAKGWMKVPSGGDASVTAVGITKDVPTLTTFYDNMGGGWFWGGMDGISTTTQSTEPEGTLNVDIFNTQTKKLIWRGTSTNSLSGNPEKNEKKLAKNVEDLFKHFPPHSKES